MAHRRRRPLIFGPAALAAAVVAMLLAAAPALAKSPVVVSLTFDDGLATQSVVPGMLSAHGFHGTFYVPSGLIDTSGHLTWGQLASFAAAGEEIGGHTVDHVDLTTLSTEDAQREVCEDRARLLNFGFSATGFAYPDGGGSWDPTINALIQQCGYNSARAAWGLVSPYCPEICTAWAESIPPANPWAIMTADNPTQWASLQTIESWVTSAEDNYTGPGPGWVVIVFHDICNACETYSTTQATLNSFLDWLQADPNVTVKTVHDVIGGSVQPSPGTSDTTPPVSSITCNGGSCANTYGSAVTIGLSATDSGGAGVEAIRYTTDGTEPTLLSPVYTGTFTVSSTATVKYRAWDKAGNAEATHTQQITISAPDWTAPMSSIRCNGTICQSGWYAAPVSVTLSAVDPGSGVASIHYTTDGTTPTLSSPLYADPFTVSSTTTVKYRAWDRAGNVEATKTQLIRIDGTAPTVAITSPKSGVTVSRFSSVQVAATDTISGVSAVTLYVDGRSVGSDTRVPYTFSWKRLGLSSGGHTLTARAVDRAGNATVSAPVTVTIGR